MGIPINSIEVKDFLADWGQQFYKTFQLLGIKLFVSSIVIY